MGILLAALAAACFGLNAVCIRLGMRRRHRDDGHFMTVLINTLLLGLTLAGYQLAGRVPAWSVEAVVAFAAAGLMTTWLGRSSNLSAIRRIGAARASAFQISAPLVTAVVGWLFLHEQWTSLQALGGLLTLAGLAWIMLSRVAAEPLGLVVAAASGPETAPTAARGAHAAAGSTGAALAPLRGASSPAPSLRAVARVGFAYALLSASLFGVGFVVRKWALEIFPHAVAGAFVGALASLAGIVVATTVRGRATALVEDNLRDIPWWFVGAGVASGAALLFQFSAFFYAPAWVVSLLHGTQALWTLLWGYLFLRDDEAFGPHLIIAVLLVVTGIALMAWRG